MQPLQKKALIVVISLCVIGIGVSLLLSSQQAAELELVTPATLPNEAEISTSTPAVSVNTIIGLSAEGRAIERYTYGTGEKTILMVGGMHGGYEWNSILLAYEFIDALETKSLTLPETLTVVIVPVLNPDGLYTATGLTGRFSRSDITDLSMHETGEGRFNANAVDLNRNFACKWQSESSWRSKKVSAGTAAFSEPEAQALQMLVADTKPIAALFWHSQANAVYASECEAGPLPETLALMNLYASAGDYTPVPAFNAYPITGDAEGWLASLGIPAITIELESRIDTEWLRNRAGVEAILNYLK